VGWVAPALFILRVERSAPGHLVELAIGLYVLHNVAYALTAFPAGALADRIGPSILLKITGLLGALTLAGFAIPGTPVLLWAFLFISAGIVTALWETVQKPWILTRLGATLQGEGFGQLSASLGVGQLVGNVLVTAFWTLVGPVWAFGIAAALALQGALQLWRVDRTAAR
jgi:MFS family permease